MTGTSHRADVRWRAALAVGMLVGLLAVILWPKIMAKLGLFESHRWFLDSYAVLAASDTLRAGLDPLQPMDFDLQHRPHIYSNWWYGVGRLGLTRADNFLLGGWWVAAFFLAAWFFLRPKSAGETAWYLGLFLSPPVLLGVQRANNDLVIFVLLVAAAAILSRHTWGHIAAALVMVAVATGLKYYPLVAGAVFLLVRPRRRLVASLLCAAVVLLAVLLSVSGALSRARHDAMSVSIYTFGAPVLLRDLGWKGPFALVGGTTIMAALVGGSVFWRRLRRDAASTTSLTQTGFVIGSAVLVGCFLTGISFAYRCAFLLLIAPWLWEQRHRRFDAKVAGWLATAVLWLDGIVCLVMNLLVGPVDPVTGAKIQLAWRFATQPLVWALMVLLIRWLLEVTGAAWRTRSVGKAAASAAT